MRVGGETTMSTLDRQKKHRDNAIGISLSYLLKS